MDKLVREEGQPPHLKETTEVGTVEVPLVEGLPWGNLEDRVAIRVEVRARGLKEIIGSLVLLGATRGFN